MAWKDSLLPGSYRGASFKIESHTMNSGRRGELHEYPFRDTPYFEDLGRKTREFTVDCFIVGDNYNSARNALQVACESKGAGVLIHPYLGTKQVVCTGFSLSERIDEGRMCRFSISFVEAGVNLFPTGLTDLLFKILNLAGVANAANIVDFVGSYRSAGLPGFIFGNIETLAGSFLTTLSGLSSDVDYLQSVARFARDLGGMTRKPSELGARTVSLITDLRTTIQPRERDSATAQASVSAMQKLTTFSADAEASRISQTTPSRVAQVQNMQAFAALIRRAALASEAAAIPSITLDSYQDAIKYAQDFTTRVDNEVLTMGAQSEAFLSMTNLAAEVSTSLSAKAGTLPTLTTTTVAEPTPALALSNELYGDPTKSDDIVARNRIRHPSFVPANLPLEVLAR